MKKILIIIIAVVLIGGGAAYYFLAVRGNQEEKPVELTSYVPGDYFVTNVADSNNLLKVTIVLMLDTDKLEDMLAENEYVIRDTIIARLRKLTVEDLTSTDIQDKLRTELSSELNEVLGIDNIVTVYFSDFVMQ